MVSVTRIENNILNHYANEHLLYLSEQFLRNIHEKTQIKTSVVIPAYNEEEGISVVLGKTFKAIDGTSEVIVVDDGSKDKTSAIASLFPCTVIKHRINKGKAEAMKTGIKHASGENLIFIDADGTYPAETIPNMIEALEKCDVVYCSRMNGRDNIPSFNRLGNAMFQNMMKYIYGFRASDYSTGLYGLKKHCLEKMDIKSEGFNIEVEIAIKASRMNLNIKEVPIKYLPRLGNSKLCGWKVGIGHLKTIASHLTWQSPNHNGHSLPAPIASLER